MPVNLIMIFLVLLNGLCWYFLNAYAQEKGKNLATKEDVAEITRKIELAKAEITHSIRIDEAKYKLKYEACMSALTLIDVSFSHTLQNPDGPSPTKDILTWLELSG